MDVRKDWNTVGAGATAKQVRAWPKGTIVVATLA